jgi:hypothetical protein
MVTVLLLFLHRYRGSSGKRTRLSKGVQVERVVINALATTAALQSDELFALIRVIPDALSAGANGFERAEFRRPISHKRREFRFTGDQVCSFKFSFARQHSRVAPDIAD